MPVPARHRRLAGLLALSAALVILFAGFPPAHATRSATGLRGDRPDRFAPMPPARRGMRAPLRNVAPVPTVGANVKTTAHFRILWGDLYAVNDPDWADPDGDGVPVWIDTLAAALEHAWDVLEGRGFPAPFGSGAYYLDAYVGNTGVVADGWPVTLSDSFYAYTDIDSDYDVAYFVFNNDLSNHTDREQDVLKAAAAHELFHAVQRVDYPWDDEDLVPDARWNEEIWWMEGTATWIEEICQPDVDDYVQYVKKFLQSPEKPIYEKFGKREYGTAVFAGYLWLRHGGADLWRRVFENAYLLGVTAALERALTDTGRPALGDAAAEFWTLVAHPEDVWPDGLLYYDGVQAVNLFREAPPLPLDLSTSIFTGPGQYGAHVFLLPAGTGPVQASLPESFEGSAWRLSRTSAGDGEAVVHTPVVGGSPVFLPSAGDAPSYLALVNTTDARGRRSYRALFDTAATPGLEAPAPEPVVDSDSGPGCFISAMAP